MIRRTKVEHTQTSLQNQQERQSNTNNRKEGGRGRNRFSYNLQNLNTDKDEGQQVCRTNYTKDRFVQDQQYTIKNSKEIASNRPSLREGKNPTLKKDYLYQESSLGNIYCSKNKSNNYDKQNSNQKDCSMGQQYGNASFDRTPIFPSLAATSTNIDEFNPPEQDIQQRYQQIWQSNQRQKQYSSFHQGQYSTLRLPLAERDSINRENIVVNRRNSISKNILKQQRSASLRSEQNHESGANTYRNCHNTSHFDAENSLQTRKSSPIRSQDRLTRITEHITLRSSPKKQPFLPQPMPLPLASEKLADEREVNIRLLDEFTSRVQYKIEELGSMLVTLRCSK